MVRKKELLGRIVKLEKYVDTKRKADTETHRHCNICGKILRIERFGYLAYASTQYKNWDGKTLAHTSCLKRQAEERERKRVKRLEKDNQRLKKDLKKCREEGG